MATFQVIDFRKIPSLNPGRRGQFDAMVTYMVDNNRSATRVLIIPNAAPSDAEIQTAIRTDLAHDKTYIGKTGTI
jgi:hypothetical protein